MTFIELYKILLGSAAHGKLDEVVRSIDAGDRHNLDCLLSPKNHNIVIHSASNDCSCTEHKCATACMMNAISFDSTNISFDPTRCVGCSACIDVCDERKLTATTDLINVVIALKEQTRPVFALLAPAIIGQFGDNITIPMIRSALKSLGFAGVIEVATFADILTLREALDFAHRMEEDKGFQLTSCCCPVWIALIKKNFNKLSDHLTAAVSPMIAGGRTVKKLTPDALTVFVSPCLAKRSEAREPDVAGAIDHVITFKELSELFTLLNIDLSSCESELKEHSSYAGRLYARSGGVTDAVHRTYTTIMKGEAVPLKSQCANGVAECKQMLNDIVSGNITANFYEGMGCVGGCIAGTKVLRDKAISRENVNNYAESAEYADPVHNPYIIKLLAKLGFDKIDDLLADDELFCRKLNL